MTQLYELIREAVRPLNIEMDYDLNLNTIYYVK